MSRAHQKLPDPPRVHTGQSKKTRRQSNPQIGNSNNNNNNKTVSSNTQLNNGNNTGAATRTRSRQFEQFFKSVFAKPDPRSESPGTKTNNQSFCNNKIHPIMFYVEFKRERDDQNKLMKWIQKTRITISQNIWFKQSSRQYILIIVFK